MSPPRFQILVSFDDQRAAAGFKALPGLSERTQVILFTHHQHTVDLARTVAGAKGVSDIEL